MDNSSTSIEPKGTEAGGGVFQVSKAFDRRQNAVLREQGLDILIIKNYEDVKIPSLAAYDVVMIDYNAEQRAFELISAIRASVYEEVYLMPCFLLTYEKEARPRDLALSDGALKEPSVISHFSLIEQILTRISEIIGVKSDFSGRKVLLKLIRYLYTRDKPLTPVATRNAHTGYSYPFLEANIMYFEYQEIFDLLDVGEEKGMLKADFMDKVHLCGNCNGGFLNYREVCPKCGSRKHKSQHTIHHFVCGYVGPESDFMDNNKLTCPKCDRQLRHIGVDYDKPSLITECENGHVFQEPNVEAYCFNCHQVSAIDELKSHTINEYNLTASGANLAVSGKAKEVAKEPTELEGFVSLSVFKTFLQMEIQRQSLSNKTSAVTYVNLMLAPSTLKQNSENFNEFSREIARVFKSQLKPTEVVTFINDDSFLVISPEEGQEAVSQRINEIKQALLIWVKSNFEGSNKDKIISETFELDSSKDGSSVLQQINERLNIF